MALSRALLRLAGALALGTAVASSPAPAPGAAEFERTLDEIGRKLDGGDTAGAVEAAEAAVETAPASSAAHLWLGRAYGQKALEASVLTKMGPARRCREAFEKAVELDPKNVEARGHLVEFYIQAPGFMGGGADKARAQADAIQALDPVRGHLSRAAIHRHEKNPTGAEAEYLAAAEADPPGRYDGHYALTAYCLGHEKFDDARAAWLALLDERPGDLIARYQLAKVAIYSATHLDEAVAHLEAYLAATPPEPGPSHADARWRLALVYEKLGQPAQAQAALREALRLKPDHAQARQDLDRLSGSGE
jgi:tetratricopeptide (TPR) repeat protein